MELLLLHEELVQQPGIHGIAGTMVLSGIHYQGDRSSKKHRSNAEYPLDQRSHAAPVSAATQQRNRHPMKL